MSNQKDLHKVLHKIIIGNALEGIELADQQDYFVINVTEHVENPKADFCMTLGIPREATERISISSENLDILANVIDDALKGRLAYYVVVHCTSGIERSPLVVTWYLHKYFGLSLQDAFWTVKECLRPEAENRISWISYPTYEEFLRHNQ